MNFPCKDSQAKSFNQLSQTLPWYYVKSANILNIAKGLYNPLYFAHQACYPCYEGENVFLHDPTSPVTFNDYPPSYENKGGPFGYF